MEKKKLIGLNPKIYEHSFDKKALDALDTLEYFDFATNWFLNWTYLKWHVIDLQGSNFLVTRESCPELYTQIRDVADTLDLRPLPRVYMQLGYGINGYTTGYKEDTLIVLGTGVADLLTDDELCFVVGHECGHILSKHVLRHTMANLFNIAIKEIPIAGKLATPIYYGLKYWQRMSEFTADRAGLLACQDLDTAIGAIIKMSGLPTKYYNKMNHESFVKQAVEFRELFNGVANGAIKTISIMDSSHPWTVLRAAELILWVESGGYQKTLDSVNVVTCNICNSQIPAGTTKCPCCGGEVG